MMTTISPALDALFGSRSAAQTLLFLQNYGEGHARRIATTFDVSHMAIQRQLKRLEAEGLLVSIMVGGTRVFTWNSRNPTVGDLRIFLEAELDRLPHDVAQQFFRQRQRPRRSGKSFQRMVIDGQTTALELAALVSQTLEAAGIEATLSGGGAVSVYTDNQYQSADLDFVTAAGRNELATAMAPIGFVLAGDLRHFEHPNTEFYLEFPRAPLAFGRRVLQHDDMPRLDTPWGPLRVITPTFCVMDRLAAFWHWNDRQSWDQAVMVVRSSTIHVEDLKTFAAGEGANPSDIDKLLSQAAAGGYP